MELATIVYGIELLASLLATVLALRSPRFWVCFPLGLLGVFLLFDAAFRTQLENAYVASVPGALGIGLLTLGLLGRKRKIGPSLALAGVHLLIFAAAVSYGPGSALVFLIFSISGIVLLVIAAVWPRIPWGPLLAVLGWVALHGSAGASETIFVAAGGVSVVMLIPLIAILWLAPNRAWSRIALYAILAIFGTTVFNFYPVYLFSVEALGATGHMAFVALGGGMAMALLRHRLFGDKLASGVAEQGPDRRATVPVRHSPTQPRSVGSQTPHIPADIFISYKREERARIETIANALRDLKLSVWFDAKLQTGNSFDDEINREVRTAKCVLVCWSSGAVASEWVRAEASIGRQRGVLTVCFLDRCEPYPPFNLVHGEDLSAGTLDGANTAWAKIVEQIGHLVGRPGLGAYVSAQNQRAALGAWLANHAADPLAEITLARLRQG